MKNTTKFTSLLLCFLILIQCFCISDSILSTKVFAAGQNLDVKVNFQPSGTAVPDGYIADYGETYASRNGLKYGWNVSQQDAMAVRNTNPDTKIDTLCQVHIGGVWEMEAANGSYDVTVSVGDAVYASTNTVNIEGVSFFNNTSLNENQFLHDTKTVNVTDGKLTLDCGGSEEGKTRINYIHIVQNVSATPPPVQASVKLQMYNANKADNNNTIFPWYKLHNTGTTPINLSDVKIRYYYTIDGEKPQNYWCDWSSAGSGNITGSFTKLTQTFPGADYYLEIGFGSGAGTLAPGASVEIQSRIAKNNWENYTQSNDHSFNSTDSNYVDWNKSTVHINGTQVWGDVQPAPASSATPAVTPTTVPATSPETTPTPTPSGGNSTLKLQMYNGNRTDITNGIHPYFNLINIGTLPVKLSDVKIRYYYSVEGIVTQNFWCDWSNIGGANITGVFSRLPEPKKGADYCLELGFMDSSGDIAPGQSVQIHSRFANTEWSNYTQSNDYSFNSSGTVYEDWTKATVYVNNTLVWGEEPNEAIPPLPAVAAKVQVYTDNKSDRINSIYPKYKLFNTGTDPINLSDVKIRYYYTVDGEKPQNYWCDWSNIGGDRITGTFIKMSAPIENADYCFELGFMHHAGTLMPGGTVQIFNRYAKNDWTDYFQSNDYSFNSTSGDFVDWNKVTVYVAGVLVWGQEIMLEKPASIAHSTTETSTSLSWEAVQGAAGYDIEVDGTIVDNGMSNTFTKEGLTPGTLHSYRVRAKSNIAAGSWSDAIQIWTLPSVPQNLKAAAASNSITVTWDAVQGASGYDIEVYGSPADNGSSTTYIHSGLEPNMQKTYRVRAKNSSGFGAWSPLIVKTTLPGIPGKISASATDSTVLLTWESIPGATGYDMEIDKYDIIEVKAASYLHTGLLSCKQHTYRVRSKNADGSSGWSSYFTATTLPAIPANLKATATTSGINSAWDAVNGATGYDIEVNGKLIDNGTKTTYILDDSEQNKEYVFRVRARYNSILGLWSDEVRSIILPGRPMNLNAAAAVSEITLTWDSAVGASGYEIEVDTNIVPNGLNTTYIHKNLQPNSQHTYRVRVINAGGAGEWSETVTKSTKLGIPSNVQVYTTSTSVTIVWDAVQGAHGYDILVDGKILDNQTNLTYTHTGLSPNTMHFYRVRAKGNSFEGEWSSAVVVTTKLGVPANLKATPGSSEIFISWNPVFGTDGYEIEVDGRVIDNGDSTSYIHKGLSANTRHTYKVRAKNTYGNSEWSTQVWAVTAPGIPTNLKADTQTSRIAVQWGAVDGATAYDLEIDGDIVENINSNEYLHLALEPNTRHSYRVRAQSESAVSEWSEMLEVNTVPELSVDAGKDNLFNFIIVVPKKEGKTTRTVTVTYNPDEVEVVDLCTLTAKLDMTEGAVEGTNIIVRKFVSGEIIFEMKNADRTVISGIKFVEKVSGNSKVTYRVE